MCGFWVIFTNILFNGKKEHLTLEGLSKILGLKASMNLGLPLLLKAVFFNITPVQRPIRTDEEILNSNFDPHWIAGFTAGEGCFSVNIQESKTVKIGFQVQLRFKLTQHSKDELLMKSLITYFGCGQVFKRSKEDKVDFQINKFADLTDKVLPLFQKISIQGVKSEDFADFCKVVDIMKVKGHLTIEGLDQIQKIKAGMNTGRKWL